MKTLPHRWMRHTKSVTRSAWILSVTNGALRLVSCSGSRMCTAPARCVTYRFNSVMTSIAELLLVTPQTRIFVALSNLTMFTREPIVSMQQFFVTRVAELFVVANLTVFRLLHGSAKMVFKPVFEMGVRSPVSVACLTELGFVATFALPGILSDLKLVVYVPAFLEVRLRFLWSHWRFIWEDRTRSERHQISYQRTHLLRRQVCRRHDRPLLKSSGIL